VIWVTLFVAGAIFGSFLNVVIYRMPRGRSIVRPPSACPECGELIRPRDNVPILSYLLLRGRCRACGVRISPRYPLVESISGVVPLLLYGAYGPGPRLAVYWPLAAVLTVLAFIDLDERIIPDRITLPGIAVGLVAAPLLGLTTFPQSLIGAVVGGGALYAIGFLGGLAFGKESMGGGDVKLAAMLGAFLGWRSTILLLFAAFLMGAVVGIGIIARKGRDTDRTVPFGPFIAAGALVAMVWGERILDWYRGLLG
jgi:leader peptidase (prepilin peptidase)/N-methyltransferase